MNTPQPSRAKIWRSSIAATLSFVAAFTLVGVGGAIAGGGALPSLGRLALLVGIAVYLAIPVFACLVLLGVLCRLVFQRPLRWDRSVLLGLLFSLISMAIGILMARDGDDPKNVMGYIEFWQRVPTAFILGVLPYLLSGVAFGLLFGSESRSGSAG